MFRLSRPTWLKVEGIVWEHPAMEKLIAVGSGYYPPDYVSCPTGRAARKVKRILEDAGLVHEEVPDPVKGVELSAHIDLVTNGRPYWMERSRSG